jgi:purine-binding chemotaxis protein CheW
MNEQSYFTFSFNQCRYGINTTYIDEVLSLPKLIPTSKAFSNIVGIFDLRGEVVPVINLGFSLGYPASDYQITDKLVVLRWEEWRMGIIVNEVHDIRDISSQEITPNISDEPEYTEFKQKAMISGIVKSTEDTVILSSPENWLQHLEMQQLISAKDALTIETSDQSDIKQVDNVDSLATGFAFYPNATTQEREILQKRANSLKLSTETQDLRDLRSLVVVALGDDFFGFDIETVREFVDIRRVTPIPCCPAYIIGNMNLRGEILTLIDLRGLLDPSATSTDKIEGSKAMVIEIRNIAVGVMIKEIGDTMFFLDEKEMTKPSGATDLLKVHERYFQGIASYHDKVMTLLDMQKIFFSSELIIDEAI